MKKEIKTIYSKASEKQTENETSKKEEEDARLAAMIEAFGISSKAPEIEVEEVESTVKNEEMDKMVDEIWNTEQLFL
jgi:hypothetical protein